jgi:hypothetical protein
MKKTEALFWTACPEYRGTEVHPYNMTRAYGSDKCRRAVGSVYIVALPHMRDQSGGKRTITMNWSAVGTEHMYIMGITPGESYAPNPRLSGRRQRHCFGRTDPESVSRIAGSG